MKRNIFYIICIFLIFFILWQADAVMQYTRDALYMCYEFIIPTLFPFFVVSGLLIYSGFAGVLSKYSQGIMRPLFNVAPTGAAAFVLGIISGFPTGAICAKDLYKSGNLSKSEAERLLAFCNNSGPLFIIGSIGVAVLGKPIYGVILYLIHIVSSIIVGIIFSRYNKDKHISPPTRINQKEMTVPQVISVSLNEGAKSIITVCFSIVFFSATSRALFDLIPISQSLSAILYGICEFSTGALGIGNLELDVVYKLILVSFIVGFSGLCVHIQVMAVTADSGLSLKPYILGKTLHSIIAAAITTAMVFVTPVFNKFTSPETFGISYTLWVSALLLAIGVGVVLIFCFAGIHNRNRTFSETSAI